MELIELPSLLYKFYFRLFLRMKLYYVIALLLCSRAVVLASSQDHLAVMTSDHKFVPEQSTVQPEEFHSTSEERPRGFSCKPGTICRKTSVKEPGYEKF